MSAHNVSFFDLTATDPAAIQRFYESVFDWRFSSAGTEDGYLFVDTDGSGTPAGGLGQASEDQPAGLTFFVDVDDIDTHLTAATSAGGSVIMPTVDMEGFGSIAIIADPEGNALGIWKK